MNPETLRAMCNSARSDGAESVPLVIRRGSYPRGFGFPRGELMCSHEDGRNVYSFKVARLLAWLDKNFPEHNAMTVEQMEEALNNMPKSAVPEQRVFIRKELP